MVPHTWSGCNKHAFIYWKPHMKQKHPTSFNHDKAAMSEIILLCPALLYRNNPRLNHAKPCQLLVFFLVVSSVGFFPSLQIRIFWSRSCWRADNNRAVILASPWSWNVGYGYWHLHVHTRPCQTTYASVQGASLLAAHARRWIKVLETSSNLSRLGIAYEQDRSMDAIKLENYLQCFDTIPSSSKKGNWVEVYLLLQLI